MQCLFLIFYQNCLAKYSKKQIDTQNVYFLFFSFALLLRLTLPGICGGIRFSGPRSCLKGTFLVICTALFVPPPTFTCDYIQLHPFSLFLTYYPFLSSVTFLSSVHFPPLLTSPILTSPHLTSSHLASHFFFSSLPFLKTSFIDSILTLHTRYRAL